MNEQVPSKDKVYAKVMESCAECGMSVEVGEYHPYAACLMYKACHTSATVRENLAAVRASAHEPPQASNEKVARLRALFDDRTKDFRRSHSEALFNEYERLQRDLYEAEKLIAVQQERIAHEPPAVPARVRLLKDIYDDGQDHHPPGYIAKKGEIVEVREVRTLSVAHPGVTDQSFVVMAGEYEPASSQPPPADCEAEATRDMLTDARLDLDSLRAALGVDYEPHQSLHERMLDAANHKRVERGVPPLPGHAAWQRDRMAKWISKNKPALPDHACAQCVPGGGEIVVEDFECVYHMALKIIESSGPTKGEGQS